VGLVYEDKDNYALLTDIQGLEDHVGAMDLKVAGSRAGVTALQLDMKVPGLSASILAEGLAQAREARLHILDAMAQAIAYPRQELSSYAPRMFALRIKPDQIGTVIGPGGKTIRGLEDKYEVDIDIEDDGTVFVFGEDAEKAEQARDEIGQMTREIEVGEVVTGKVVSTTSFGAFVEIAPGRDGLVHISELAHEHVAKTEDVVKVGDEVKVKVIDIDPEGKIRLSRKALLDRSGGRGRSYNRRNK